MVQIWSKNWTQPDLQTLVCPCSHCLRPCSRCPNLVLTVPAFTLAIPALTLVPGTLSSTLSLPASLAFGPLCSRPSRVSSFFYFVLFPFAYTRSRSRPHPLCHMTPCHEHVVPLPHAVSPHPLHATSIPSPPGLFRVCRRPILILCKFFCLFLLFLPLLTPLSPFCCACPLTRRVPHQPPLPQPLALLTPFLCTVSMPAASCVVRQFGPGSCSPCEPHSLLSILYYRLYNAYIYIIF